MKPKIFQQIQHYKYDKKRKKNVINGRKAYFKSFLVIIVMKCCSSKGQFLRFQWQQNNTALAFKNLNIFKFFKLCYISSAEVNRNVYTFLASILLKKKGANFIKRLGEINMKFISLQTI